MFAYYYLPECATAKSPVWWTFYLDTDTRVNVCTNTTCAHYHIDIFTFFTRFTCNVLQKVKILLIFRYQQYDDSTDTYTGSSDIVQFDNNFRKNTGCH